MYEQECILGAPTDRRLNLWIEPWAEGLSFPAGTKVTLRASSQVEGWLELDEGEGVTTVYAWPGCTLRVLMDDETVRAFDTAVPAGLSAEKVRMLFGAPPSLTDEERVKLDGCAERPPGLAGVPRADPS